MVDLRSLSFCDQHYADRRAYHWPWVSVICQNQSPASLENLEHYLPGYTSHSSAQSSLAYVIHEVDRGEDWFESLKAKLGEAPGRQVNTHIDTWHCEHLIMMQGGPARLYVPRRADGYVIAAAEEGAEIFLCKRAGARHPERHLLRIVREVLYRTAENAGACALHAACVAFGERAFIIVGPSGAGKTTLLLKLLSHCGCDFVTNDRVLLWPQGNSVIVHHLPLSIRIGLGSALNTPRFREFVYEGPLRRGREFSREALNLAAKGHEQAWGSTEKLEFTPQEFIELLGVKNRYGLSLKGVLAPKLQREENLERGTPLSASESAQLIDPERLTPADHTWPEAWLVRRTNSDAELAAAGAELIKRVAHAMPCMLLEFGVAFEDRSRELERWLAGERSRHEAVVQS